MLGHLLWFVKVVSVSWKTPVGLKLKWSIQQRQKLRSLQGFIRLLACRVTLLPLPVGSSLGDIGALRTLSSILPRVGAVVTLVLHWIRRCISAPGMFVPMLHTSTRLLPQAV